MLIQFTVSAGNSNGWDGLLSAIKAAATATAGSNPAKPTNVAYWNILDNTVAGGWTAITDTIASVVPMGTGQIFLTAPLKKTDVTASTYHYKKGVRFTADASYYTSNANGGVGSPRIVKYRTTDGATWEQDMQPIGTTPVAGRYDGWLHNGISPTSCYFTIAVTSEYLIIHHHNGASNANSRLLVVADHTLGSPDDFNAASLHTPFYGMMICNSGAVSTYQTTADSVYFDMYMSFVQHKDPTSLQYNTLVTGTGYLSGQFGTPGSGGYVTYTQNYMLPVYPSFLSNVGTNSSYDSNYMFRSDYNSEGFEKPSINDIVVGNIARGYFPRTLIGIKQVGITRTQYNIDATPYQSLHNTPKYITSNDASPITYYTVVLGKQVFAIPKA